MINQIAVKKAEKTYAELINEKNPNIEAAKMFGYFFADGIRGGLTPELSFGAAKKHFELYGQAMIDISKAITLELITELNKQTEK